MGGRHRFVTKICEYCHGSVIFAPAPKPRRLTMKQFTLVSITAAVLVACSTAPGPRVEAGYPTGSLAVAAIERGDWATAERLLNEDRQVDRDNPARLINLGRVYVETGRTAEAMAV